MPCGWLLMEGTFGYFVSVRSRALITLTSASAPETAARAFACLTSACSNSFFNCTSSSETGLGRGSRDVPFCASSVEMFMCVLSRPDGGGVRWLLLLGSVHPATDPLSSNSECGAIAAACIYRKRGREWLAEMVPGDRMKTAPPQSKDRL